MKKMIQQIKGGFFLWMLCHMPNAMATTVADVIEVGDPYVRIVPPGAMATGVFMTLTNHAEQPHQLVKAHGTVNEITELHTHINDKGIMRMREVPSINIPAQGQQFLKPGGYHVMLIKLTQSIEPGQKVAIQLFFEDGSSQTVQAVARHVKRSMH